MPSSIVELSPEHGNEGRSSRVFYIYEALRANRGEAAEIVGKYAEELFRLGGTNQAAPTPGR